MKRVSGGEDENPGRWMDRVCMPVIECSVSSSICVWPFVIVLFLFIFVNPCDTI